MIINNRLLGPGVIADKFNKEEGEDLKIQNLLKIDGKEMKSILDKNGRPRLDLSYSNLEESNFFENLSIENIKNFKDIRYRGANLKNVNFGEYDFHYQDQKDTQNNYNGCDISGADLYYSRNINLMKNVIFTKEPKINTKFFRIQRIEGNNYNILKIN